MATEKIRSSKRLESRKPFQMPTRDDVLGQIEADRTPHKGFSHLQPRKLIHDLVKGHNRYNNLDPISLYDDDAMSDFIDDNEEDSRDEESDDSSTPEDNESGNADYSDVDNSDDDDYISDEYETQHTQHSQRKSASKMVRRKKRRSIQLISDEESDNNNNGINRSELQTHPGKHGDSKEMREIVPHDGNSVRQHGQEKPDAQVDVEDLGICENAKMRRRKRRATLESSDEDTHEKEEDDEQEIGMKCSVIKRRRIIQSSDEDT